MLSATALAGLGSLAGCLGSTSELPAVGDGGPHNVAFADRDIRLDSFEPGPGVHFEHTFEDTGVYRYACEPHEPLGQRGAIVAEERQDG